MFRRNPLTCQLCSEEVQNCEFMQDTPGFIRTNSSQNPKYNGGWVNKYCNMEEVEDFLLYFPYVLIIIPLIMLASEKGFDGYI